MQRYKLKNKRRDLALNYTAILVSSIGIGVLLFGFIIEKTTKIRSNAATNDPFKKIFNDGKCYGIGQHIGNISYFKADFEINKQGVLENIETTKEIKSSLTVGDTTYVNLGDRLAKLTATNKVSELPFAYGQGTGELGGQELNNVSKIFFNPDSGKIMGIQTTQHKKALVFEIDKQMGSIVSNSFGKDNYKTIDLLGEGEVLQDIIYIPAEKEYLAVSKKLIYPNNSTFYILDYKLETITKQKNDMSISVDELFLNPNEEIILLDASNTLYKINDNLEVLEESVFDDPEKRSYLGIGCNQ